MPSLREEIEALESRGFEMLAEDELKSSAFYQTHFKYHDAVMRLQNIDLVKEVLYKVMYKKQRVFITETTQEILSQRNASCSE